MQNVDQGKEEMKMSDGEREEDRKGKCDSQVSTINRAEGKKVDMHKQRKFARPDEREELGRQTSNHAERPNEA